MGIKKFNLFIEKYASDVVKKMEIKDMKGKYIIIDAYLYIYKSFFGIKKELTNEKGENINLEYVLSKKIIFFLKNDIYPIFVLDGKPSDFKKETLEKRKETSKFSVTEDILKKCIDIFEMYGVQYILSDIESDIYCAALSRIKDSNIIGVLSEDNDLLMYGTKRLIKQDKTKFYYIDLNELLNKINMNYKDFVLMCIYMGTDYYKGIKNFGPVKLYNYFSSDKKDEILNKISTEEVKLINEIYEYIITNGKLEKIIKLKNNKIEIEKLENFYDKIGINKEKMLGQLIEKTLTKIKKTPQTSLTNFFKPKKS